MEKIMSEKDEDCVDIPASQQEFTFTYTTTGGLDEQICESVRSEVSSEN
tara:strand:- start:17 stop:163 length:147 start_codon:yes stop_codon:yes gene_type:complete